MAVYALARQALTIVERIEFQRRPLGYDAGRVDGLVAGVVMVLDMPQVHGRRHARPLVQLAQPVAEIRVIGDAPQVALCLLYTSPSPRDS